VPATAIAAVTQRDVQLSTARLDLRDFAPREGETALAARVLDHQLVDIDGARVVRAADLYLATIGTTVRLVGVDVSVESLRRRLGAARWRTRPTPDAAIDWASVQAFGPATSRSGVRLGRHRGELNTQRPAELADLLEDLGRRERQALLDLVEPDTATDALEEMEADQLHQLLIDADPADAADLLARMEPDEAAEALRSLTDDDRRLCWARCPRRPRRACGRCWSRRPGRRAGRCCWRCPRTPWPTCAGDWPSRPNMSWTWTRSSWSTPRAAWSMTFRWASCSSPAQTRCCGTWWRTVADHGHRRR
jgi:hypothetical protein